MKKVAWVTDSSAVLDEELKRHPHVYVLPVHLIINGQSYLDGVDLTTEDLVRSMDNGDILSSSQPSVGDFVELYERLADGYDLIFSIHVSSALSGTYSTSLQAGKMVNIPVYSVDSSFLSYPLTLLLKKAIKLWDHFHEPEIVIQSIHAIKSKLKIFVWIGSLQQLHKSGRLSASKYLLGSLMKIKPIVTFEEGKLEIKTKVRTWKQATEKISSYLEESETRGKIEEIFMLYGRDESQAKEWKDLVEAGNIDAKVSTNPLGTALVLHAGTGTVGIGWLEK
ncbi:DegV family protein [Pradoshia eiseniae]|uniref:DegV family protein n=1 Tax=Pradoshia eiseniae TaxID=2064768 RepID=A0A2S7N4T9_9BACI|nr:DegV family protein [Pradoshia eiseniae]PQD96985.1 DegV family protein [Pradoshia eiseniae]